MTEFRKNAKSLVFLQPPPPQEWEWDLQGRPTWFPVRDRGRWVTFWSGTAATGTTMRLQMPALDVGPLRPSNPFGRPATPPDTLGWAIFRHRFLGESYAKVADALGLNNTQTATKRVQTGEARLHALGVIPWGLWPDGKLPPRWWEDDRFVNGACRWIEENTGLHAVLRDAAKALPVISPFRRTQPRDAH